jgi:alanine dehydrogenase
MKIGIIREGKTPPDKRVPLTPSQCNRLLAQYPDLQIAVQPSPIRAFSNEEYERVGITLQEDLSDCEVLFGVKEVPYEMLIPNKTYLFFSHTYKQQPYNRGLLQEILKKKIRLIDYEMLKEPGGKRLLGFGRYAGIVGTYNAFRAWGEMHGTYHLKPAHDCHDRREMEAELIKVDLPPNTKIILTGAGRVAGGAMEILSAARITQVFPKEFVTETFKETVYTQLDVRHYYKRKDGAPFTRHEFYKDPAGSESNFLAYAKYADIYIPCHFWSEKSPYIFTREDARHPDFNIKLVSDISCDIDGPVASTLRPSTIADPFYGYDPQSESETALGAEGSIGVSAVDNLPCELPRDASEDFGNELIKNVMPHFFNGDARGILDHASETNLQGELTEHFAYLQDYVNGETSQ